MGWRTPGLYAYIISGRLEMDNSFKIGYTIECLERICKHLEDQNEVPFHELCEVLVQFTFVFKQLNSFLGIAFDDVHNKVAHIKNNCEKFPGHPGFFSFINMEMQKNIHTINGKDNKKKKLSEDMIKYASTARSLLRMMWLMTFVKVAFERCRDLPEEKLSTTFASAYDAAFANNHNWMIRNSAKLAMYASEDRKKFIEVILGSAYDEESFREYNQKFLRVFAPVHDRLWDYYRQNNLTKLD